MKKIITKLLPPCLFLLTAFILSSRVYADNSCDPSSCPTDPNDQRTQTCLKSVEDSCTQLISQAQGQEKTLKSQLEYIDNQTQLTQVKIAETTTEIAKLELEITTLSGRIDRLSSTVDSISEVLINQIVETYKYGNPSPLEMFFSSSGFADVLSRLKYLQIVQNNDKTTLYQLQATKQAYNDQKADKEARQEQSEQLKKQLQDYQTQLADQKKAKQELLTQTQGSEANYQKLLAQAQAQLAAFQSFVKSQGGVTLITADPGWPSDYYSQRDTRWGNNLIGNSQYTIGEAGCLISSVAMVLTHKGNSQTPQSIAGNSSYFFDGNFLWSALTSLGFNTPSRTTDTSKIDSALNSGKWAIVGISYSSNVYSEPFHFVVVTSKNGSDYNLFDPWKGPNVSFNDNYSGNHITEVITY